MTAVFSFTVKKRLVAGDDFDRIDRTDIRDALQAAQERRRVSYENNRTRDIVIIRRTLGEADRAFRVKLGEVAEIVGCKGDEIIVKDNATSGRTIDVFHISDKHVLDP